MPSCVVVGVANPGRGDDAAGWLVVERLLALRGRAFDVVRSGGDVGGLLDCFAAYDEVILVDATPAPGPVVRLDAATHPLPVQLSGASSHMLGLAHAVELARTLGRLPRRLIVYAVPGQDFSHKTGVSPATALAVRQVAALIRGEFLDAPIDPP